MALSRQSSMKPIATILQDALVLAIGLGDDAEICRSLVEEMGGNMFTASDCNNKPTVVISGDVTTEKYRVARDSFGSPIVKLEWLRACRAAGRQVPFTDHLVGPFEGLKVCATGVTQPDRIKLNALVTKGGGEFSSSLTKDCTHLVCLSPCDPNSKKMQYVPWKPHVPGNAFHSEMPWLLHPRDFSQKFCRMAKKWRISLVLKDWVFQSSERGVMQNEKMYPVAVAHPAASNQGAGLSVAERSVASARPQRLPPSSAQYHASRLRHESGPAEGFTSNGSAARSSNGGRDVSEWNASISDSRHVDSAACSLATSNACEQLYLDGVRVVLCCCSKGEATEASRLARIGGAIRQPSLSWSTTHLIMGSERPCAISSGPLAVLRDHMRRYSAHIKLVSLAWLVDCANRHDKLEPDERHLISVSNILQSHEQPRMTSLSNAQPTAPSSVKQASQAPLADGAAQPAAPVPKPHADRKSQVLQGLWFVLAAVEPWPKLKAKAVNLINQGGGSVYPDNATLAPTSAKPYAVCPWGFLPSEEEVANQDPLFQEVDEKRKVTIHWLEFCVLQHGDIVNSKISLLFKPLPHAFPLPWMSSFVITTSGYDEQTQWIIRKMIRQLGAKFTDKMTRKNTHLIIQEGQGIKYLSCERLQVTPVSGEWLGVCAAKGIHFPEAKCQPKPLSNTQRAVHLNDTVNASQLPSQIQQTQQPPKGPTDRRSKNPGLLSMTQAGDCTQPDDFLGHLLKRHKVPQSQVARHSNGDFNKPDVQQSGSAIKTYMEKLVNQEDSQELNLEKPENVQAEPSNCRKLPTTQPPPPRSEEKEKGLESEKVSHQPIKDGAQPDEAVADRIVADLLRVAEEADSSQLVHAHFQDKVIVAPSADIGPRTRSRGGKRGSISIDANGIGRRTRRAVSRQMPHNDSSNPEVDFMASQMDADTKVVYQQGEKTAQALERCSGRPVRSSRHSAKDFLNRAVLSGIDSNHADKHDELKEMGLL